MTAATHQIAEIAEQRMAAGKTKQQAIVCIMRKLVNVIHYLMRTKATYVIPGVSMQQAG
ncbi:hypothetical protein YDYSY3_02720 [Paenibacillus chitinolyticus]|nr:hypothetical protein YDYSY3_02720 [Paenibacillus chitinolyticus]